MPRVAAVVLVLGVVLPACSGDDRPEADEWDARWQEVASLVPDADTEDLPAACEELIGAIRSAAPDLRSTPDPVLDEPVGRWIELVEGVAFDCDETILGDELDEIEALGAEIEADLAALDGG